MDKFKQAITNMLVLDANGRNEFDKIYYHASRQEKKKVKLDYDLCKEFVSIENSSIPLISALKSREVMRDIITYMNYEVKVDGRSGTVEKV